MARPAGTPTDLASRQGLFGDLLSSVINQAVGQAFGNIQQSALGSVVPNAGWNLNAQTSNGNGGAFNNQPLNGHSGFNLYNQFSNGNGGFGFNSPNVAQPAAPNQPASKPNQPTPNGTRPPLAKVLLVYFVLSLNTAWWEENFSVKIASARVVDNWFLFIQALIILLIVSVKGNGHCRQNSNRAECLHLQTPVNQPNAQINNLPPGNLEAPNR